MNRKGEYILLNRTEQENSSLPTRVKLDVVPVIYRDLEAKIKAADEVRKKIEAHDVHDMSEADRQARAAGIHERLHGLDRVRLRLGQLAAPEIAAAAIDESIEALGIDDLDLARLYQK